jgi:hypothetical protein
VIWGALLVGAILNGAVREAWLTRTLTVAVEFLAGHFLFGRDWKVLLADYNLAAGRIWLIVLVVTLTAPVGVFKS